MVGVELQYWMRKWELDENLIYKEASEIQACFVRSRICISLLKSCCFVISTHRSKSCLLPVYFVKMRNGIKLTMRNNFYDWKVSVEIPEEYDRLPANYLPLDCMNQHDGKKIPHWFCEGFYVEWCYDAYRPQQPGKKFTIEIPDDERLYVVLHYLKHAYPDKVFNVADDKRTAGEIKADIDKILDANGFNDMRDETLHCMPAKRRVMNAWEIIRQTYSKMNNLYYDDKMDIKDFPSVSNDSQRYADCIMEYPEVHEEWLMEEWLFKIKED